MWFQASEAKKMRTALFWVITQRIVVIPYRRFGITYVSHLQRRKFRPIGWPETTVRSCHYTVSNITEERSFRKSDSFRAEQRHLFMTNKYRVIRNDYRGFNNCHLVLQMQPYVISFYGVTSRIGFMFLLFPQLSRNWRYESEPPLKPSPLTCGTNKIIMLMFVESQRVHI